MLPESSDRGGGEAGLIALIADQDQRGVASGELSVAVSARGVEPPFEHVAGHEVRARDRAVSGTLAVGADVDQLRAVAHRGVGLPWAQPGELTAGCGEQLLDGGRGIARRVVHGGLRDRQHYARAVEART